MSFAWVIHSWDADRMFAWAYPTFVLMIFALLVTVSNSDQLSLRVRRDHPGVASTKRALAFLFFNGAAGGLIWVAAILSRDLFCDRGSSHASFPKPVPRLRTAAYDWFAHRRRPMRSTMR